MRIFHPDVDWRRVVTHIPHGVFSVVMICEGWRGIAIAIVHAYWFIRYEENEDKHTGDQAWKDKLGAIIGLVGAALVWRVLF